MHRIVLIAHGANNIDVLLFNPHKTVMPKYSITGVNPLAAYVHLIGLVQLFKAAIDQQSAPTYHYLVQVYDADQRVN